jgi:hypothetical protein
MVRYLVEKEDNQSHGVSSGFIAEGVYTIGNTPGTRRQRLVVDEPGAPRRLLRVAAAGLP